MRRGCICIEVNAIKCDRCHQFIEMNGKYLVNDDDERWCWKCCLKTGNAARVQLKDGTEFETFFPPDKCSPDAKIIRSVK